MRLQLLPPKRQELLPLTTPAVYERKVAGKTKPLSPEEIAQTVNRLCHDHIVLWTPVTSYRWGINE
jgi:hypothetical protein